MILPRVRLFLLGGTITMKKALKQKSSGVVPSVDAAALCRAIPGLDQIAELEALTLEMIASGNLTYGHAYDLVEQIEQAAESGQIDGVVVVQGTDSLEEMAFLLDCLLEVKIPVVVTGAMRSPENASPDGPANILAAVTCAATNSLAMAGVVVVMNDDIHAARFVSKSHTGNVAAFQSPNMGPIGRVVEGAARLFAIPVQGPKISIPKATKLPNIALIKATYGDDGYLLGLLENSDCQGLVIEAFGAGHVPEKYLPILDRMAGKFPIILTSRTRAGHVFRKTYGYRGAEIDLIARGLIPSGILDGVKAKILLTLLVMSGTAPEEIARIFDSGNG